jgi:hypothetical protein
MGPVFSFCREDGMEMVRMVTTSEHVYAGHRLAVDEEFDCEEQHVDLMHKLGRAKLVEARPAYQTRDMTAEAPRRSTRSRNK